jgi:multidrug efflux pump
MSSSDYRDVIVTYQHGAPVRLSDVADVIDSAENVKQAAWMNAEPAIIVNVQRQPGATLSKSWIASRRCYPSSRPHCQTQ